MSHGCHGWVFFRRLRLNQVQLAAFWLPQSSRIVRSFSCLAGFVQWSLVGWAQEPIGFVLQGSPNIARADSHLDVNQAFYLSSHLAVPVGLTGSGMRWLKRATLSSGLFRILNKRSASCAATYHWAFWSDTASIHVFKNHQDASEVFCADH